MITEGKKLERMPGSSGCFVCGNDGSNPRSLGVTLMWCEEERAVYIPFEGDATWCGYDGVIHGGILASLFDDAMGWALHREVGEWGVTADFRIRYRRPAFAGRPHVVKGEVVSLKGRKAKMTARIYDAEDKVTTEAEALFITGIEAKRREN